MTIANMLASTFEKNDDLFDLVLSAVFGYAQEQKENEDNTIPAEKINKAIGKWQGKPKNSANLDEDDPQEIVDRLKNMMKEVQKFHDSIEKED